MLQGYLTYLFIHYTLFNGVPAPVFSSKRRTKVPNVPEQNGGNGGNGGLVNPFPESFCKSKTYMVQFLQIVRLGLLHLNYALHHQS